jgi:hypothetical protein
VTDSTSNIVSVSATIGAPAGQLFEFLARPANHPRIDGSGMLRESTDGPVGSIGDVFTMTMHNEEMGDYVMANYVVEYEPGRRIGWEPEMKQASRPEDRPDVGVRAGHRWSFQLTPLGPASTLVTETFDCSAAPEDLRRAVRGGTRWTAAMTATLRQLGTISL